MNYQVEIMPQAQLELLEVAEFIALDNPYKANEFFEQIIKYISETLSLFPKSGMVYKNKVRKLAYKNLTVFYSINETKQLIEVLHIIDLSKPIHVRNIDLDD